MSVFPESGSAETLQLIKKRVSIPKLLTSMRTAVSEKLNVKCNFIFGFPKDRWKNILESYVAIAKSAIVGIHDIAIWVFVPYPGSELFRELQAEGRIQKLDDDYFYRLSAYADITKTYSYCKAMTKKNYSTRVWWALSYSTVWPIPSGRGARSLYSAIPFPDISKAVRNWRCAAFSNAPTNGSAAALPPNPFRFENPS